MLDRQLVEQALEPLPALLLGESLGFENRKNVLFHRELSEDGRLLRQVPDAAASPSIHGKSEDVLSVHENPAGVRSNQPDDHVEGGGLPRPIGPEQPHDLSLAQLDVHRIHHPPSPVNLGEPLPRQDRSDNRSRRAHRFSLTKRLARHGYEPRPRLQRGGGHLGPYLRAQPHRRRIFKG